jgi:hypothetical protein
VSVVQSEAEVEEPSPNVANEFNSNEIVRKPSPNIIVFEVELIRFSPKFCPSSITFLESPLIVLTYDFSCQQYSSDAKIVVLQPNLK